MTRATNNEPLQGVYALLELIENELGQHPDRREFDFDFELLRELNPIFSSVNVLEHACKGAEEETGGAIIGKRAKAGKIMDHTAQPGVRHSTYTYFSFFVTDKNKLEQQKKRIGAELKNAGETTDLVLERESGKLCEKDGNPDVFIQMRKSQKRYKILQRLYAENRFVTTRDLASEFTDGDADAMRRLVNKMKAAIRDKFDVSLDSVIESGKDEEGYRVKNLEMT